MSEKRMERVKSTLMKEVALIINREIKDPRFTGLVSVTKVEISPDMHNAYVYVSVFTTDKIDKSRDKDLEVLNHSAHYIMFLLSKKLTIKYIPELEFRLDTSMEEADRMNRIFNKIKTETTDGTHKEKKQE
jgi:ribosome-binding factor A